MTDGSACGRPIVSAHWSAAERLASSVHVTFYENRLNGSAAPAPL